MQAITRDYVETGEKALALSRPDRIKEKMAWWGQLSEEERTCIRVAISNSDWEIEKKALELAAHRREVIARKYESAPG